MKDYFEQEIAFLEKKIEDWNKKNFFQRLFSNTKWSNDHSIEQLEKIFNLGLLKRITSQEDYDIYLIYFLDYGKSLPEDQSISIIEFLLESKFLNPKIKNDLLQLLEAKKATQYYYSRANELINIAKGN